MADYVVTGPDGARYKVTAPDDMAMDAVLSRFRREYSGAQQPAPATEASAPEGVTGKEGAPPNKGSTEPIEPVSTAADVALSGASGLGRAAVGAAGIPGNLEWMVKRGAEVAREARNVTGKPGVMDTGPPTLGGPRPSPEMPSRATTTLPTSADVIGAFE